MPNGRTLENLISMDKNDFEKIKNTMMKRSIPGIVSYGLAKSEAEAGKLFEREWPTMKKGMILQAKFYSEMPTFIQVKRHVLRELKSQGPVDRGLPRLINKINSNSDLVTTYSCSGIEDPKIKPFHRGEGRPVIGIQFSSISTMKPYLKELRRLGYEVIEEHPELKVQQLDKFYQSIFKAMGFMIESEKYYPSIVVQIAHTNTKENFTYGKAGKRDGMATLAEAEKFWKDITRVLSKKGY